MGRPLAGHGDPERPQSRRYISTPGESEVKGRKCKSAWKRGEWRGREKVNLQVWERLMDGKLESEGKRGRDYEVR